MSVAKLFFAVDALDSAGRADYVAPATLGRLHLMIATSRVSRTSQFEADPGFRASVAAVIATARAALSDTDGP